MMLIERLSKVLYRVLTFAVALVFLAAGYTGLLILREVSCEVYDSPASHWIRLASLLMWGATFVLSLVCLGIECWGKRYKRALLVAGGIILWLGLLWLLLSFLLHCLKWLY